MNGGTRAGTGLSSANAGAARSPDQARRWAFPLPGGRMRSAARRGRPWAWVLAAGLVMVAAVRAHGAADDVRAMSAQVSGPRLAWLSAAVGAQIVSLAGCAAAQRQLLVIGNTRLPWRALFGLVLASTGLARMMPAGPVTGGVWQVREYRRRGADPSTAVWAVLAGGFTSAVVLLTLLLAGAAIASTGRLPLLVGVAMVLAAGAAGLTAAPGRAHALSRLSRHHRSRPAIARIAAAAAGLSGQRAGVRWAAAVLAATAAGLAADAGVLTACFGLAGLPIPWRGLLFAYAAGQLAGRLVPLPGGLGGVEGGALGALTLTGTPPAAAAAAIIVYRVAGYWTLGAAGATVAAVLSRHRAVRPGTAPATPDRRYPGGRRAGLGPGSRRVRVPRPVAPDQRVPCADRPDARRVPAAARLPESPAAPAVRFLQSPPALLVPSCRRYRLLVSASQGVLPAGMSSRYPAGARVWAGRGRYPTVQADGAARRSARWKSRSGPRAWLNVSAILRPGLAVTTIQQPFSRAGWVTAAHIGRAVQVLTDRRVRSTSCSGANRCNRKG